ncbi:PqqD family protein [Streptomyces kunmingensis]|uniref:PqqD family protein n=1 Tax=Streptomyces kunmingensis TaxID=68225 RepID=A0ABU6CDD5_9ACTN|nr:PqqD family protein [Streptomyces kunmingensis]MEB3962162.1 PqqD family protein [Streptomyces kunmingensis]
MRPVPQVRVHLDAQGHLHLAAERPRRRYRCAPVCAAMWLALQRSDGELGAAAASLAALWECDPVHTLTDLEIWAGELRDAGLVRSEPCASAGCLCSAPARPPL